MAFLDRLVELLGGDRYFPHAICLNGDPFLLWAYIASNLTIWLSYMVIGICLVWARRQGIRPAPVAFNLFAAFIVLCGWTHFFWPILSWVPIYRLDLMVEIATAVVSAVTAIYVALSIRIIDELPR